MAQIENHRSGLNEINQQIRIETAVEPDPETGVADKYQCWFNVFGQWQKGDRVHFQQGPVYEGSGEKLVTHGVNAMTEESVLAILIHRLRGYQKGKFSCRENAIAITHLEESLNWLHNRTRDRVQRVVIGKPEQ